MGCATSLASFTSVLLQDTKHLRALTKKGAKFKDFIQDTIKELEDLDGLYGKSKKKKSGTAAMLLTQTQAES